ncbi:hypothetical protein EGR_09634 [Echinococcus granulosus]|uniref:Uncharacterized protein n=1 Tax=Echinococcus granulosus TaxID=6210 RepID=W6U334_ECHGR|nr:hypothetical protein EGR_09634 [Echinococcus granulosus]EUB55493.1 hypothetical protein EGR_09634 [Echinococcus granulosus]
MRESGSLNADLTALLSEQRVIGFRVKASEEEEEVEKGLLAMSSHGAAPMLAPILRARL